MAYVTLSRIETKLLKEANWTDVEIKDLRKQYGDYVFVNLVKKDAEYGRNHKTK